MLIWHYTSVDPNQVGGVEKHISELKKQLTKEGLSVSVGRTPPQATPHTPVVVLIHGDMYIDTGLIEALRRTNPLKVVATCHGTSIGRLLGCGEYFSKSAWLGAWKDYSNLKVADAYIAVSQRVSDEVERYFRIRKKHLISHNGADAAIFSPDTSTGNNSELLFFGRASDPVKNLRRLLDAAKIVKSQVSDFSFSFAPGLSEQDMPSFARPFIKNLGKLDAKASATAMKHAKGLVLCSLYEGDGIVLHEAKSMGLPVLVSDLAALRQNIGSYDGAYWVNPKDTLSIANGMRTLLNSKKQPTPMNRSWGLVAKEHLAFFKSLF